MGNGTFNKLFMDLEYKKGYHWFIMNLKGGSL